MGYSRLTCQVAAYLRRKLPYMRAWDPVALCAWVQWFLCHHRAITLTDGRRLVGVTLFRLVDDPHQANDPFADTGGRVAYIEAVGSETKMMPYMFQMLRRTFPVADTMAWVRCKYDNRPNIVPMARMIPRLTHGA